MAHGPGLRGASHLKFYTRVNVKANTYVGKWTGDSLEMLQCFKDTEGHLTPQRLTLLSLPPPLRPPPTQTQGLVESPQSQLLSTPHAPTSTTVWDCLPLMCCSRFGFCGVSHLWMGFYTASQRTSSTPFWWTVVGPREETGWLALTICRASPFHHLQALLFLLLKGKAITINRVKVKVRTADTQTLGVLKWGTAETVVSGFHLSELGNNQLWLYRPLGWWCSAMSCSLWRH